MKNSILSSRFSEAVKSLKVCSRNADVRIFSLNGERVYDHYYCLCFDFAKSAMNKGVKSVSIVGEGFAGGNVELIDGVTYVFYKDHQHTDSNFASGIYWLMIEARKASWLWIVVDGEYVRVEPQKKVNPWSKPSPKQWVALI